ncbi:MAG: DASS family sodium-coupled anion symporter [Armatimonadetes bacterium]|nr:DASS family sodium-coupled anion symporter [Armatimonadota bacterium]
MSRHDDGPQHAPRFWTFGLSCLIGVVVWALLGGLDPRQRTVAAVFAFTVALWMTEAVPLAVAALTSTMLLVLTGAMSGKDAFGAYGDPIVLLFVGSFILAKSMEDSGLDRRVSFWILSRGWASKNASSMLLTLGGTACLISLFVSNTATTAMLLPIGINVLKAMKRDERGDPVATSVLLMLTWGSSIAVGTIIGTPPNVIGVGLIREATGTSINFLQWAVFGMPVTVVMLAVAWLQLRRWRPTDVPTTDTARTEARSHFAALGPMSGAEKVTLAGFLVAVLLWTVPGIVEYATGIGSPVAKLWAARVPEAVAALAGAVLLFVVPCPGNKRQRAMDWHRATRIEWGTVLLFAGGLALGKAAFDSGLAKVVGESLATTLRVHDVWSITALTTALGIVVSELASNTAAASTVVPVAIALAQGAGVSPVPAALGATIGSNLGFMLPVSTPPNAIVYSSGLVPSRSMLRAGLLFDVIGYVVTMLCLRTILPPMGLA